MKFKDAMKQKAREKIDEIDQEISYHERQVDDLTKLRKELFTAVIL